MSKLNELWDSNRLVYILIFLLMFAIAILVIFYVLQSVVVNSKRYYFL